MLYVTVTGWANLKAPPQSLAIAEAMHDQGLGDTQALQGSLDSLPAQFGPFDTFQEAQSVSQLLMGYGALAMVVEE